MIDPKKVDYVKTAENLDPKSQKDIITWSLLFKTLNELKSIEKARTFELIQTLILILVLTYFGVSVKVLLTVVLGAKMINLAITSILKYQISKKEKELLNKLNIPKILAADDNKPR